MTLTSRDGDVEITGDLLGFDGEFYRVDTIYGELTVDGSGVLCEGPGCPNLSAYVAEVDAVRRADHRPRPDARPDRGFALRQGLELSRDEYLSDIAFTYTLSRARDGRARAGGFTSA